MNCCFRRWIQNGERGRDGLYGRSGSKLSFSNYKLAICCFLVRILS